MLEIHTDLDNLYERKGDFGSWQLHASVRAPFTGRTDVTSFVKEQIGSVKPLKN